MSLLGAFGPWRWQTIVSVLGIVMAAAYMLKVIRQVLLGPLNQKWANLSDMTWWEWWTLVPLMACTLALGVSPLLLLRIQDPAVQRLVAHVTAHP